jgi:hypothetical protein
VNDSFCKYSKQYQGLRKPACNKGNPCELCLMKFNLQEATKVLDRPPFKFKGKDYAYVAELKTQLHYLSFKAESATLKSLENL